MSPGHPELLSKLRYARLQQRVQQNGGATVAGRTPTGNPFYLIDEARVDTAMIDDEHWASSVAPSNSEQLNGFGYGGR